jgi:hypothetical protein
VPADLFAATVDYHDWNRLALLALFVALHLLVGLLVARIAGRRVGLWLVVPLLLVAASLGVLRHTLRAQDQVIAAVEPALMQRVPQICEQAWELLREKQQAGMEREHINADLKAYFRQIAGELERALQHTPAYVESPRGDDERHADLVLNMQDYFRVGGYSSRRIGCYNLYTEPVGDFFDTPTWRYSSEPLPFDQIVFFTKGDDVGAVMPRLP